MIDESIYLGHEHVLLRDQVRRFVEQRSTPHAGRWEEEEKVPRSLFLELGTLGLLGIRYPSEYGGAEMDTIGSVVLAEELARSTYGGVTISVLVHTDMASPHLANAGTDEQKQRYLPRITSGEIVTAVAITEPDAGSDVAGIKTRAVLDGDEWVINGSKMFITNGVHADLVFVAARTDPAATGSRGMTIFMLEKGTPGFSVGRALKKTGWLSSDTAELVFDDCRVPSSQVLGAVNRGFYSVMQNFQNERNRVR